MKKILSKLKALAEENRLRIIMALTDEPELCVCQIVELLGLAPSTVSKHLSLLYQADVIDQRKDGRWAFYRLNKEFEADKSLYDWLVASVGDSERIAADRKSLKAIICRSPEELCRQQAK